MEKFVSLLLAQVEKSYIIYLVFYKIVRSQTYQTSLKLKIWFYL